MKHSNIHFVLFSILLFFFFSCNKVQDNHPNSKLQDEALDLVHPEAAKKILVSNINQLYNAINNPANAGSMLVLAPGTYMLDSSYPNGGRLDLLRNMSLMGQQGDAGAVVIDVSALPRASVTLESGFRSGAIRTGNGNNTIEWMTLQSNGINTALRSIIQTDIAATSTARVRIAHTIIQGANIGINITNRDVTSNGRTLEALIEDNEIRSNTLPPFGDGILILSQLADNGTIKTIMRRNYIHGNLHGVFSVNSGCRNNKIDILSYNDRMEDNGLGIGFWGGHTDDDAYPAENNIIRLGAFNTDVRNNTNTSQPLLVPYPGGIFAAAGELEDFATKGVVNNNRVDALFTNCRIEGNTGTDQINAFGAYSFVAGTVAGAHNVCTIHLKGGSKNIPVNAVGSSPVEPAGTNKAVVYRQ